MASPTAPISRFRLGFSKLGNMRWSGHLDLRQSWERTFRRARLPLFYSAGHHPQPKLLFASPLPLGFTSEGELLDAWLVGDFGVAEVEQRLSASCPPGLQLEATRKLAEREPQVTKLVVASRYVVKLPADLDCDALSPAIAALLGATHLRRERRNRTYDLRPLIEELTLDPGERQLELRLSCLPSQTGRPDEVLRQLAVEPADCKIHRREQVLRVDPPAPSAAETHTETDSGSIEDHSYSESPAPPDPARG